MTGGSLAQPIDTVLPPGRRTAIMWMLFVIYVLNYIDRQVVSILAEPIKQELRIADWQIGLMSGLAFAALYTLLGLPLARLAESTNRKLILGGSLILWSGFTAACGMAASFAQLVAARVGVGVGEAGFTPTAHSLIADITPRERRGRALAFFATAQPTGALVGLMAGGLMANFLGWRAVFVAAGAAGIVLAPLFLLVLVEPRTLHPSTEQMIGRGHFAATLRYLAGKKTYWRITAAGAVKAFITYGQAPFMAAFFLRNFGAELTVVAARFGLQPIGFLGVALGLTAGLGGILSSLIGGIIADRAASRDPRGMLTVPAIAALIAPFFLTAALLVPSLGWALLLQAVPTFLVGIYYGANYSLLQGLVPTTMRTLSASIYLFTVNLLGLGLGPLAVGALSDLLAGMLALGSGDGLRWSLILTSYIGIAGAYFFHAARRDVREELVT